MIFFVYVWVVSNGKFSFSLDFSRLMVLECFLAEWDSLIFLRAEFNLVYQAGIITLTLYLSRSISICLRATLCCQLSLAIASNYSRGYATTSFSLSICSPYLTFSTISLYSLQKISKYIPPVQFYAVFCTELLAVQPISILSCSNSGFLELSISSLHLGQPLPTYYSFFNISFLMPCARYAQLRVVIVQSRVKGLGLMHAIIMVRAVPPSESFNSLVSLLSRQGMWLLAFFLLLSISALMQLPKDSRLLLILVPYCLRRQLSVFIFYEPARSITKSLLDILLPYLHTYTFNFSTACERDESWLDQVAADVRLAIPELMSCVTCYTDFTCTSFTSTMVRLPFESYPIDTCFLPSSDSRSLTFSLQISIKLNLSSTLVFVVYSSCF